jgi:hypothetical protein
MCGEHIRLSIGMDTVPSYFKGVVHKQRYWMVKPSGLASVSFIERSTVYTPTGQRFVLLESKCISPHLLVNSVSWMKQMSSAPSACTATHTAFK